VLYNYPGKYADQHSYCVNSAGDDVQILIEGAESTEGEEEHAHEGESEGHAHEGESEDGDANEGVHCHEHAGIP
jgi:zinc transporter 1/2/3